RTVDRTAVHRHTQDANISAAPRRRWFEPTPGLKADGIELLLAHALRNAEMAYLCGNQGRGPAMTGGFDHPDLGLRHQVPQAADGVDVDGPIVGRDHDQYRLAPASEEVAIVPSDPVAQPLAGGAPVGA